MGSRAGFRVCLGGAYPGVAYPQAIRELEGGVTLPKIGKNDALGGASLKRGCVTSGLCFGLGFFAYFIGVYSLCSIMGFIMTFSRMSITCCDNIHPRCPPL